MTRSKLIGAVIGIVVLGSAAGIAGAAKGGGGGGGVPAPVPAPAPAPGGGGGGGGGGGVATSQLKVLMTLVAGENPGGALGATQAVATFDGRTKLRVHLGGMDPATFPAPSKRGTIVPCVGTASIGAFSGPVAIVVAPDPVTGLDVGAADFLAAGTVKAGDKTAMDIVCNVSGVIHETHWAGTF